MRVPFLVTIFFALAIALSAQSMEIVKSFEQNKARYTREHFAEGEDASSGFDYLFYKNGPKIVKVRSIWSATHTKELRVEDSYLDGTSLILLQRMVGTKHQLKALIKGRNVPLTKKEELYFKDSKLVSWTVEGKPVTRNETLWAEAERSYADHGPAALESYNSFKEDK